MRILLVAFLCLGAFSDAQAQSIKIDGADVQQAGIYKLGKTKEIENPDISTGQRTEASTTTLLKSTTIIPAKDGTTFGVTLRTRGRPAGKVVPFRIVWRYPEPGLRNPDAETAKLNDDYVAEYGIGQRTTLYWTLGDPWTRVAGKWIFEFWYEGRKLATQSFTLVQADESGAK